MKELHECHYNDRSYREGEIIESMQTCYDCICSRDFDNQTDVTTNPSCQKKKDICNAQLYDLKQYQLGCVPVYYGKHPETCPTFYQCREFLINFICEINNEKMERKYFQQKSQIK